MNKLADLILNLIFPQKCAICGHIAPIRFCPACQNKIKYLNSRDNNIICVTKYEGVIKKAIRKLKFGRKKYLAPFLGKIFTDNLPQPDADFIIPVPISPSRLIERGFNQSEMLAEAVSNKFNIPKLRGVLIRIKDTKAQFEIKGRDRNQNLKNAFKVINSHSIKGTRILLVDDIFTTGATVKECSRALINAGAAHVAIATLSRA